MQLGLPSFLKNGGLLKAQSECAFHLSQKDSLSSSATTLKTVASHEGKADGSIFLFGVQIKKYFRSLRLRQPSVGT
jgi:hypothetical protein